MVELFMRMQEDYAARMFFPDPVIRVGNSGGSTVSFSQTLTSGTESGKITIDGVTKSIYAPTPPTVSADQVVSSGTEIGGVTVNNARTALYAPTPPTVSADQVVSSGTEIGGVTVNNARTALYAPTPPTVSADQVVSSGTEIGGVTINGNRTPFYAPSGSMRTYSSSEQRVGTWTDGKPIYQKTYDGTTSNVQTDIPISLNLERLVDIEVSITANDGTKCGMYYEAANDKVRAWVLAGSTSIRLTLGASYPSKPVTYSVTIWYTKTTDTV